MKVSMIAAVAENRVIGKDNDLVWRLPDDMKFFMEKTIGHTVLMGRKNWESIPKKFQPLPERKNIVISRNKSYPLPAEVSLVHSMSEALEIGHSLEETEFFIIGGGDIYKMGLPIADTLYLTEVRVNPEGDAFFPEWNREDWQEVERIHHPADHRHQYSFDFVVYRRR